MKHSKEDIITIGQEIFRKNGYHATGISDILQACNISKGTFYNYFESKEEFAIACLKNYSSQIQRLLNTYMGFTSQAPSKRLYRYFDQLIKINQKEGSGSGCLLMNLSVELGSSLPLLNNSLRMEFNEWMKQLVPTIEEAQKNNELTNKISATAMARLIYYEVYGGFSEMKVLQTTNRMEHQLENLFKLLKN